MEIQRLPRTLLWKMEPSEAEADTGVNFEALRRREPTMRAHRSHSLCAKLDFWRVSSNKSSTLAIFNLAVNLFK